jgi:glycosyltransferase involved in cell wall biosynthesis
VRVLHVQKVKGIGGSERHLLGLLPALASRGAEVRMCVLGAEDYQRFSTPLRNRGIDTVVAAAGPHVNPMLVGRLAREIRAFHPDIVHTHLIHADLYGQLAARLIGVPGIISMHSTQGFYLREPYRSVARIAAHLARCVIAISDHVARFAREARLTPQNGVRVVPYGVDDSSWKVSPQERAAARDTLRLQPSDVAVGVASRLIAGKGHSFLLEAFARALPAAPELRMVVAGDGPLRAELEEHAREYIAAGLVNFLGFVEDMRAFLNACDVLAFPTMPELNEGFGLAVLEAMAAARPVVATRVASLPEIVIPDETGFLVDPGGVSELSRALVVLAKDFEMRVRLGRQGHERAKSMFSMGAMVDRTLAVYEELV